MKTLTLALALLLTPGLAMAQSTTLTPFEARMVDDFHYLDEECRGGIYAQEATQKACGARDYLRHLISVSGLCFEKRGDFAYDGNPHRCEEGSVRYDERPF